MDDRHGKSVQGGQWRDGPIPKPYLGLWRRLSFETGDGLCDIDTTVFWLQSQSLYADLRIPANRPDMTGASSFGELNATALNALASQEGFAGTLQWKDDGEQSACAWRRWIDFAPLDGPPDEGLMKAASSRMMVETGLHADYTEHWWQDFDDVPQNMQTRWNAEKHLLTVRVGDRFMLAHERRMQTPPAGHLHRLVADAVGDEARLRELLDCELSIGRVGPDGIGTIELSTVPWREGCRVHNL